jgi:ferrous iron transport protein A
MNDAKTIPLARLALGESGTIVRLGATGPVKRRLMDMGILPGQQVRVEKVAPLGDPIDVRVKGYELTLRKDEAERIDVEVAP